MELFVQDHATKKWHLYDKDVSLPNMPHTFWFLTAWDAIGLFFPHSAPNFQRRDCTSYDFLIRFHNTQMFNKNMQRNLWDRNSTKKGVPRIMCVFSPDSKSLIKDRFLGDCKSCFFSDQKLIEKITKLL